MAVQDSYEVGLFSNLLDRRRVSYSVHCTTVHNYMHLVKKNLLLNDDGRLHGLDA